MLEYILELIRLWLCIDDSSFTCRRRVEKPRRRPALRLADQRVLNSRLGGRRRGGRRPAAHQGVARLQKTALGQAPGVDQGQEVPKPKGRRFLAPEPPSRPAHLAPGDYDNVMERYEREVIEAGLAQGHGRIAETCRLLGISRNTLRERMRRYGLAPAGLLAGGTPEAGD
jgi:hypothetical protein